MTKARMDAGEKAEEKMAAAGSTKLENIAWRTLTGLLLMQFFTLLPIVIVSIVGAVVGGGDPLQNLSIVVLTVLALVWVAVSLFGSLRSRSSWVRGSALTLAVLWFATGTGLLQMQWGAPALAWLIIVQALMLFASAMLSRPAASAS